MMETSGKNPQLFMSKFHYRNTTKILHIFFKKYSSFFRITLGPVQSRFVDFTLYDKHWSFLFHILSHSVRVLPDAMKVVFCIRG